MTLEQLRVFVAVAERQHMTRAAEALNLAQSAVSAAIGALEGRHGTKLFNRVGRGIELTQAGQVFLDEARSVLARAESAEMMLADLAGLKRGTLLIQASQTLASSWLPSRLVSFRRAYPAITIKLVASNTAEVAAAVLAGRVELGFVEGAVELPLLTLTEVARDQLVVVVAPDHPLADKASVTAADLAETEWVLREPGSGTRSVLEQDLRGLGVDLSTLNIALELPTNEAVRAAVEAGMGATAISATAAVVGLEPGLLVQVAIVLPTRSFNMIHHMERTPSAAAKALMEIVTCHQRA